MLSRNHEKTLHRALSLASERREQVEAARVARWRESDGGRDERIH